MMRQYGMVPYRISLEFTAKKAMTSEGEKEFYLAEFFSSPSLKGRRMKRHSREQTDVNRPSLVIITVNNSNTPTSSYVCTVRHSPCEQAKDVLED